MKIGMILGAVCVLLFSGCINGTAADYKLQDAIYKALGGKDE